MSDSRKIAMKLSYEETTSDSDNDSIFSLGDLSFDWLMHLVPEYEFNNQIKGLKSMIFIPQNTVLEYYGGKYITKKSDVKKIFNSTNGPCYIVQCNKRLWIDGNPIYPESNVLSFINHSCIDTNCSLERLTKSKIIIRVIKNIPPGEFLHYNYNLSFINQLSKTKISYIKCLCHTECNTKLS
jgi:hypothetical protein